MRKTRVGRRGEAERALRQGARARDRDFEPEWSVA